MKRLLTLAFIFTSYFSIAQTNLHQEETATVTATNSNQKSTQTGRNIVVIKGKNFEHLAINSVDELLRYAAGIEVQQRGPQGAQSDILIRGGTFQQVLVLLDGVRLNDPLTGHFNGNIPIHPNEIDRIEVLKGAASAVWGSDAVGGVIHIITKAFVADKMTKGTKSSIGFQLGDFGLNNFNAAISKKTTNAYYSIGAFSNNAEGQALRGTNGFFNLHTIHGSMQQQLSSGWKLNFKSILDYRKFNAQNFYTTFKSDTANEAVNTFFNHLQLTKSWNKQTFTTDISYKALSDEFQFNRLGTPNKNRTKQLLAQFNYTAAIDDNTSVVTGVQLMNRSIRSNDRGKHNLWNGGTWFILKHQWNNKLFVNEGVRFDYNENYGFVATPQLNVAYNPGKWTVRASYAQGIRDADFTERYNNYNKPLVTSGSIGNPDLQTERTWNTELGADYVPNTSLKISTTAFYRNQTNLIDWTNTPYAKMPRKVNLVPTGTYALASNLANVKTYGVELDINYNKKISDYQNLTLQYNLTRLKSENQDSVPSFYISGHANWLSQANIIYTYKKLSIAVNSLYKARNNRTASAINASISKDYFVVHTKVGYSFYQQKVTLFAQAHNLFNKQYSDILGAVMPGRWLSGGVNVNL